MAALFLAVNWPLVALLAGLWILSMVAFVCFWCALQKRINRHEERDEPGDRYYY